MVFSAEQIAAAAVTWLAAAVTLSYLADLAGLGVAPLASSVGAAMAAAAVFLLVRRQRHRHVGDLLLWAGVTGATLAYLLWLAWPSLLPRGSGPDLTHHLLLVDYIERQGRLPHEPDAVAMLGEMADYTPGVHLLATIAGTLLRTDGFHAIYPVVALAVAFKLGFILLILLRLFRDDDLQRPLALAGVCLVLLVSTYSLGSFTTDSFFAQVVSELFAIALWWTLVVWSEQPEPAAMSLFAVAGIGVFLTWPVWIGPLVVALAVMLASRRDLTWRTRRAQAALALAPVAGIAVIHAAGRMNWVSILGTSGAVVQPSPAVLGWWLPLLALPGLMVAVTTPRFRAVAALAGALGLQALVLWWLARERGAATPYMAIKMTYLAIYPAIACALIAVHAAWRVGIRRLRGRGRRGATLVGWLAVLALAGAAVQHVARLRPAPPIVSDDLWAAGRWARTRVPPACVDYLVGNEYTAYWLHLAVLGNSRAAPRTADNDTFLTQPSFERWLVGGSPRYAVANLNVLPAEIRHNVDVMVQFGSAAVIARRDGPPCP